MCIRPGALDHTQRRLRFDNSFLSAARPIGKSIDYLRLKLVVEDPRQMQIGLDAVWLVIDALSLRYGWTVPEVFREAVSGFRQLETTHRGVRLSVSPEDPNLTGTRWQANGSTSFWTLASRTLSGPPTGLKKHRHWKAAGVSGPRTVRQGNELFRIAGYRIETAKTPVFLGLLDALFR